MARCARPGCNHLKRKHGGTTHTGPCKIAPTGHCSAWVGTVVEPPLPDCTGVEVTGNLQAAINDAAPGTTFCLAGTYPILAPLRPKPGQRFIGPAAIVAQGSVATGFALKDASAENVEFVDLDISGFTGSGVQAWVGLVITRGRIHHNLTNGLGFGADYTSGPVAISATEVDHNGSEAELGSSSGGLKVARLGDTFLVNGCNIHDNIGNGVWADVQCVGTYRITNNQITRSSRKGVAYEKSGASDEMTPGTVVEGVHLVAGNTVTDNGWENREHAADGGITGVSSRNMVIEGNTTSGNHRGGIVLVQDDRLSGDKHGWQVEAVVRDNDVSDGIIGCDLPGVTCA